MKNLVTYLILAVFMGFTSTSTLGSVALANEIVDQALAPNEARMEVSPELPDLSHYKETRPNPRLPNYYWETHSNSAIAIPKISRLADYLLWLAALFIVANWINKMNPSYTLGWVFLIWALWFIKSTMLSPLY